MINLAIVVGHTKTAPGASAVAPISDSEYPWNSDRATRMVNHVSSLGDATAQVFFRDEGGIVGAYKRAKAWGADAAIELHFNAASPAAEAEKPAGELFAVVRENSGDLHRRGPDRPARWRSRRHRRALAAVLAG